MKDLIAKLQLDANCALGAIWMHIDAQASRIVELETQLKDHSAQAFSIGETYANALSRIAELEAQLAAEQAPVREVPETWISVEDRLPKVEELVIVYAPAGKHSEERIDFDFIDPNDDDHASWFHHNEHYEHFCVVAKPEGSIGPSEKAPYTHWLPLPAAPVQQEAE